MRKFIVTHQNFSKIFHNPSIYTWNTSWPLQKPSSTPSSILNVRFLNDENKFENYYNEIYPPELILKKEKTSHTDTTWRSNSNILIQPKEHLQFQRCRISKKIALYHQKCFLQPLSQKYFESVKQLPLWYSLLKYLSFF